MKLAALEQAAATPRARAYRWLAWGIAPILLVAHAIGMWWLDRWSLGVAFEAYLGWQRILANAAVSIVAMLLLAALTRKLLASLLLVSGLQALMFIASATKLRLIGMPLVVQDAYFVTALDASVLSLLARYIQTSWDQVLVAVLVIAGFGMAFRFEPPWCGKRGVLRLGTLVLAAFLLANLYSAGWPWTTRWYDKAHVRPSPLDLSTAALRGGQVASMVYSHGVQRHREYTVDSVALREALAMASRSGAAPIATTTTAPDVVIVLSESFMDPRILNGMGDLPDVIPNVRRLLDAGQGGMMLAPAFGGATVRTEFEVLTGMPVSAFPDAYYPYVDMNPGFLPGIVSVLERAGYASLAIHGNAGGFWNRTSTYGSMGVDRFYTRRDLVNAGARVDGSWLSDASMTTFLLERLSHATRPTVAVAISIQNHGPYTNAGSVNEPGKLADIRLPQALDAGVASEFRNYLYHLRSADEQFQRLLEGLQARGRPFVLMFFGDHLPAMAKGAYDALGFVDGRGQKEQRVPWVLVAGTGKAIEAQSAQTAHWPWQLPARALALAGRSDPWFDFVRVASDGIVPENGLSEPRDDRLMRGIRAGANARLQNRFEEYADAR